MIKPYFQVRATDFILNDYILNDTSLASSFHVLVAGNKIVMIESTFVRIT